MDHELTAKWHELDKIQIGLKEAAVLQPDLSAIQAQIGDLSDLTTEAKGTLVAAINEAARTGGGGAGSMGLRVADGYIQYSTDGGGTWTNLIAVAELKGDKGDTGAKGDPGAQGAKGDTGAAGADGITPTIGDNGNWYLGATDTGKPSRGATGEKGDTGATGPQGPQGPAGAPGKDGAGMDITGATVGQIAKITAVDSDGKPTAWSPVDMPSGNEMWELIHEQTLGEAADTYTYALNNVRAAALIVTPGVAISAGWKFGSVNGRQFPANNSNLLSHHGLAFVFDLDAPIKFFSTITTVNNFFGYGAEGEAKAAIDVGDLTAITSIGIVTASLLHAGAKIRIYVRGGD